MSIATPLCYKNLKKNLLAPQNNLIISENNFSATEAVPDFHSIRLAGGLVDKDLGDGRVQHDVQVGSVLGRAQEGARDGQARTVAVCGLCYRESSMVHAV